MPDKPEEKSVLKKSPAPQTKRRGWFRRLLKWVGILLLILAIFHRPIFHTVVRLALIQVASKQNLKLDVRFSGTIFTNLNVRNVSAVPNGKGPSPVDKIAIESVQLNYSIPRLIKEGVGEFLQSYALRNAEIILRPQPSKNEPEKQQKKSLAQDLNNLLAQPALYADQVNIDHFTIVIHSIDGKTTEVRDVQLYAHPWEPGHLKIQTIAVPGLPVWGPVDAKTSYAQRNLFIEHLQLSPELVIDSLNFDASQRAANKGGMQLKASVFGGYFNLKLSGDELKTKGENLERSYNTKLVIGASGVDAKAAARYFGAKEPPVDRLGWLKVDFTGEPEKPRTWLGNLSVRAEGFAAGKATIDSAESYIDFKQGVANIYETKVLLGTSSVGLKSALQLPESVNDFPKTEGDVDISVDAPDLAALTTAFLAEPIGGVLTGGGRVGLHNRKANVDFNLTGSKIGTGNFNPAAAPAPEAVSDAFPTEKTVKGYGVGTATIKLKASKALDLPEGSAAFDGLESQVNVRMDGLSYTTFTVDSVQVDATTLNDLVTLHRTEILRGENNVTAKGTYRLPREKGAPAPLDAEFAIQAPRLDDFKLGMKEYVLSGRLDVAGKVKSVNDALTGSVQMNGGDFTYGDFKAAKLAGKVDIANNEALIDQIALNINETDQIAVAGKVGLKDQQPFEGAVMVLFKDLAVLQPLLATFGVTEEVGGALDFSVESQGTLKPLAPTGMLKIAVNKAHYGKVALTEFRLATLFSPEFVESSDFHVALGATSLDGKLAWREGKASLKEINLMQGTQQALTGYVIVPLDLKGPEKVPLDQRLGANVNAKDLDIAKLMETLGQKAPVNGTVSMHLLAAGTGIKPILHLTVAGRNIKSPAAAKFDAAELDFGAHYSNNELTLDTTLRQKDIQPLVIKGRVPLEMEALMRDKKLDPELPIDLTVNLPPSSLAFVPRIVPAVRSISGNAAINARVSGTVGKPVLSGATNVNIEYARMNSGGIPNIGAFALNLGFTEDSITVQKLHGELGGGTFDVGGKILLPKLNEPTFDLTIKSDEVLVKRDESITVRVDTDIKITGPLAGGVVKGNVWVTHSRFFRDIDILPIALPGRPKPAPSPRSVPSQASISLPPPMDKWTFDIAIKTRNDDPFLVRGNLANGSAGVDLKFGGTGAEPFLEGVVRVDSLVATLPFSKLNITRGFITFSRTEMLQPTLDITAESDIREYRVNVAIYGKANNPQLSITSEPPLAQQDLLSLLATGTTLSELSSSPDVIAGRAASLVFQQLYRKIFKGKGNTENVPVLNRFEVEAGGVDNRTGRQAFGGSFKINDNIYLLGNINIAGEFVGRVRYLLRFR